MAARKPSDNTTPPPPQPLTREWVIGFGIIAVLIIAALALQTAFALQHERTLRSEQVNTLTATAVSQIRAREQDFTQLLRGWSTDERLRTTFEHADQVDFQAQEALLAQRIPNVRSVHLIRVESGAAGEQLLLSDDRQLSYAGVDLVREVRRSGQVSRLEVHRVNHEDEHLAIAGPVLGRDQSTVLGVIHLMLPVNALPLPVAQNNVQFVLQQSSGGSTIGIWPKGAADPSATALVATQPIPRSSLQMLAWQPTPEMIDAALLLPSLIVGAVVLALGALVLYFVAQAQQRRLAAEVEKLCEAVVVLERQQPPPKRNIRARELKPLDEVLEHFAHQLAVAKPAPGLPPAQPLAPPMDDDLDLDLETATTAPPLTKSLATEPPLSPPSERLGTVPARIFRSYDIRGLVGSEINEELMNLLGRAVGTDSQELGSSAVLIGRDQRPSSGGFAQALGEGLRASGCDIIDLGVLPTPVLYYASHLAGNISAAMVTASHNPAEYNGLKLVFAGQSATPLNIAKLRQRLQQGQFSSGEGSYREQSVLADYFDELEQDIRLARPLKVVIDCGFATPALLAPKLFRAFGCEVIELRCDLNDERTGLEISNPADPSEHQRIAEQVLAHGADIGFGFDGDGDRLGVVDSQGQFISTDRILMVFANDLLARLPGSNIVFDVKCSRHLAEFVKRQGGTPLMWKSGHALIKEKRAELNAPLAGEYNGHIMFADRWNGFDDAFYAGARLLEILALDPRSSHDIFAEFTVGISTPELVIPLKIGEDQNAMEMILETKNRLSGVQVDTTDGLRIDTGKGWGLVQTSNNSPGLVFRFEADNEAMLKKIQDLFRRMMQAATPHLELPF